MWSGCVLGVFINYSENRQWICPKGRRSGREVGWQAAIRYQKYFAVLCEKKLSGINDPDSFLLECRFFEIILRLFVDSYMLSQKNHHTESEDL